MDFKLWLSQPVWVNDNTKAIRRYSIQHFQNDLEKWMRSNGYEMDSEWKNKNMLAKWLYAIHVQECVKGDSIGGIYYPGPNHRDWPEDRDTYEVYILQDDIDEFLYKWRTNEDFDPDTRVGERVRDEILRFLYIYLDLDSSKHGRAIARIMADTDDEDDDEKPDKDVYLVDAQEGWHGGGWQKV